MSYTKIAEDVMNITELPNKPTLSASDLKAKFDKAGSDIKTAFNGLIDELMATTSASNIGAANLGIGDNSGANVQAKLAYLLAQMQSIVQGGIADGSITEEKLNTDYANSLAKKNGELQGNLNAQKLGGKTLAELNTPNFYACTNRIDTSSVDIETIPEMSSSSGADGWTAYDADNGVTNAWKAFDGSDSTACIGSESNRKYYIIVEVPEGKRLKPTSITYKINGFTTPVLQGSESGADDSWVDLLTLTSDNSSHTTDISTNTHYRMFRIYDTTQNSTSHSTYTFNLKGELTTYTNLLSVTADGLTYIAGNVIGLKIPNTIDIYAGATININSLGAKAITNVLSDGSRYYKYNGTGFELYSPNGAMGTCSNNEVVNLGFTPSFVIVGTTLQTPTATGFKATATGKYIAFR